MQKNLRPRWVSCLLLPLYGLGLMFCLETFVAPTSTIGAEVYGAMFVFVALGAGRSIVTAIRYDGSSANRRHPTH
ncbi:MAG: hypothetical protein LBU11_12410 [Zoogloeaceae bacterium]|nr:hypothetical protein [Zoogloeaceae bacterium]